MNKILKIITALTFTVLAWMLAPAVPASAACSSLPYPFINAVSIVDANTMNANNTFLRSCAVNVDYSQIGAAGIYASQIIPNSTANATFGGTYGYRFAPSSSTSTPLQLFAPNSPTADIFDVYDNTGANLWFSINADGTINLPYVVGNTVFDGTPQFFSNGSFMQTHGESPCAGVTDWMSDSVNAVAGVYPYALGLSCNGTNLAALDNAGNFGIAGAFKGSGAGLIAGSVPNSALTTNPLTSISAGLNTAVSGSAPTQTISTVTNPTFGTSGSYGTFLQYGYGAGLNSLLTSNSTTVSGVGMQTFGIKNASNNAIIAVDGSGNLGAFSDLYAVHGVYSSYVVSVGHGVPFDGQSGGSNTTHIEHGHVNITSPAAGSCTNGAVFTFNTPFTSNPDVTVSAQANANVFATYGSETTTSFTPALCTAPGGTGGVTSTVWWIVIGS